MKKLYTLLLLLAGLCLNLSAQTSSFGDIDTADLKMTSCAFEKTANAMVLFDVATVTYNNYESIIMQRHKRIKIFNDKGTSYGNIHIEYFTSKDEDIKNIEAQTINLVKNKIEVTPIDKKLIYTQKVDKQTRAVIFALPNVKAGSVVEYKYTWKTRYGYNFPDWFFQGLIPTRYSELDASTHFRYYFNILKKVTQKFVTDTTFASTKGLQRRVWALKDIPGFRMEPYMHSVEDNVQSIYFKPTRTFSYWDSVAWQILSDPDFGGQLKLPLDKETELVAYANELKTENEKIAFLFNTVKNTVKWNEVDRWFTQDGVQKAWLKKTGNSTEINLILYHFLKLAGIKASLLVLSTRENGEIELGDPGFNRLNKTVVRVPIDSLNYYVMDATGKYNTFNNTPYELLGLNMLTVDPEKKGTDVIKLKTNVPSKEVVFVNARIKPIGNLEGNVQVSSSNYKRISKLETYDKIEKEKYLNEELKQSNNNLHISGHRFMNMEVDTLPLREDFEFKLELTEADDNYIYFSPNLFTGLGVNPFLSETRLSDIDFIYLNNYSINGRFTVPSGFKIDAMPRPLTIVMPDNSISFKRTLAQAEGVIMVHYTIDLYKTRYTREEYAELREFYKKMYEMLNEQIVLKKS